MPLPDALLMDYAAGTASPAIGLLMATHLSMVKESRELYAFMEDLGGAMLDRGDEEPLERISAASVLDRADRDTAGVADDLFTNPPVPARNQPRSSAPSGFVSDDLPKPLHDAELTTGGDPRWRWIGFGVAATQLAVSNKGERAHLLWAKRRTGIATHRHIGREVVLVLQGAFWDDGVLYGPGDVAVNEHGSIHTPHIDSADDCLCLAVTEAPVEFTGMAGMVLNRFCRF